MTDEAHDDLVQLFFTSFPSVDGEELGYVLCVINHILEKEVERERERLWERLTPSNS